MRGHVRGHGPHPELRSKANNARSNDSDRYCGLGRILCGSSALFCLGAIAQWRWIPRDSSALPIFGIGSVIAGVLGLLAFVNPTETNLSLLCLLGRWYSLTD